MKCALVTGLLVIVAGYLALCAMLYFSQDAMLYHPTEEVSNPVAGVLWLESGNARLKIWTIGSGSKALLYFGGNGENVANAIPLFDGLLPDTRVYLANYRGYGGSSGSAREQALYDDAATLFDYASDRHERVSVIGRSLGSGVATWLAANLPVSRMALVTPYDSVESVASANYPIVPVSLLLRDKYRSIDRVENTSVPTLILMAERDAVIPRRHTLALAERFPAGVLQVITVDNVDHNSIGRSPAYSAALGKFLRYDDRQPRAVGERQ